MCAFIVHDETELNGRQTLRLTSGVATMTETPNKLQYRSGEKKKEKEKEKKAAKIITKK